MGKTQATILVTGIALAVVATACELFSIAAFYGFGAEAWPICGSACEVWPGIPTGRYCILICVFRNGAYIPLFYAGLAAGCIAAGAITRGLVSRRSAVRVPVPAT